MITWRHPNRPVFCAWGDGGMQWDTLARSRRISLSMIKALEAMGSRAQGIHVTPRQARYGTAVDLTYVSPELTGHTNDQIADELAHGETARRHGVIPRKSTQRS